MSALDSLFEHQGRPYGRAYHLFDAEEAYAQEILRFKGYLALSDALKCFFSETVEAFNTLVRPSAEKPLSQYYSFLVPRLVRNYAALCGAERVAVKGYPFQGYTLLRNVFDSALHTSAALQHVVSFFTLEGLEVDKPFDKSKAKKLRKQAEFEANRRMTGSESGLPAAVIAELKVWDDLFDYETHGGRLSATLAMDWMKGTGPLHLLPRYDEQAWVLYMNRYTEIGWMLLRLLPNLQPPDYPFGSGWDYKWRVLDQSFAECVSGLSEHLGKPIGDALVALVESKFPFSEKSRFPL
jgi:hypothetical protein